MTTRNNPLRIGNFTSSNIYRLMGTPKPRKTYIDECNMERKLERPLSNDATAKPMSWGIVGERKVFELLGTEYSLVSQETIQHPEILSWVGSPDAFKKNTTVEIKCPYTLKSFCELVDIIQSGDPERLKKEKDDYYWQIVSNSVLLNHDFAELIVYTPYFQELGDIVTLSEDVEIAELYKTRWISLANYDELPSINKGGYYQNLNIMPFEVLQTDKDLLKATILECEKELIQITVPA
jgi:hypothetical protein